LLDAGNRIHQGQRDLRIVNIGPRVLHGQRGSLSVHNQMTLRTILAPIRGIRAGLRPPKSARTEQLSKAEVDQSMASACPNSFRRACQIFCQMPAACQSRRPTPAGHAATTAHLLNAVARIQTASPSLCSPQEVA
jgi:hypothetical protein